MNELEQDDNAKKRKMDEVEINLKVSDKKNEEEEETMNQQDLVEYEKKLILNTKEYLIAEMEERKRKEMAEYVLHQELIVRVMSMEVIPGCSILPNMTDYGCYTKRQILMKLQTLSEDHLRNHQFYEQLHQIMVVSPDNGQEVSLSLPERYCLVKKKS
jgi:hypothetical protein